MESVGKGFVGEHRVFGNSLGRRDWAPPWADERQSPGESMGPRLHHWNGVWAGGARHQLLFRPRRQEVCCLNIFAAFSGRWVEEE